MARLIRQKLKFDETSALKILQEVYNDTHNMRARITKLLNIWQNKIKETDDIAAIGANLTKLLAEESKMQDQKIVLLKVLKEVVFAVRDIKKDEEGQAQLSTEKRNEIIEMMNKVKKQK